MKHLRTALFIAAAFSCAAPRVARAMACPDAPAQTCECVHPPVALPALSGPPEWFEVTGDSFWRPTFHDPRWSGAPLKLLPFSDQLTVTDALQTRIVHDGNYIYLSFQTLIDDQGPDTQDNVYLGITQGSASQAYAIKIPVSGNGSPPAAPASGPRDNPLPEPVASGVVSHWASSAAGSFAASTEQFAAPTWLDQIAIWKPLSPAHQPWGVTMRINKSSTGLNPSAGSIRMFLGVGIRLTTGTVPFANANPVAQASSVGASTIIPPNTANWVRYAEIGTACTGNVTVTSTDVGVYPGSPGTNPTGALTNRICAQDPCPVTTPGGNPENVFRVIMRNVPTSGGIGNWALRARMRIADWGSSVADWKYGPWKEIATAPGPVGTAILTGSSATMTTTNGWYFQVPTPAAPTSNVVIDYKCKKQGADVYCPKITDPLSDHQCMLVEIGQQGTQFEIAQTAVYRNMDYYGLSSLDRPATISLAGLKQATGLDGERDVYLYVETLNMPKHGDKALWLPADAMRLAASIVQDPPNVPQPPRDKLSIAAEKKLGKEQLALRAQRDKEAMQRAVQIASSTQMIGNVPVSSILSMSSSQLLDGVWPTYRIRPFYDTGRTFTDKAGTTKVLAPMVEFGFRLSHDGAFYGFAQALESADPGIKLEKISDAWYKVHFKSEAAPAKLRTKISAEEKPSGPGGGPGGTGGTGGGQPCPECGKCPECKVDHGNCHCRFGRAESTAGGAALVAAALAAAFARRRRQRRAVRR